MRKGEWWTNENFVGTRKEGLTEVLETIIRLFKYKVKYVIKFKLWQNLLIRKDKEKKLVIIIIGVDNGANIHSNISIFNIGRNVYSYGMLRLASRDSPPLLAMR